MYLMRTLLLTLTLAVGGCAAFQKPGVSLVDAQFAEPPVIVQRGEHFYLRYRRAIDLGDSPLRSLLIAKKTDDAGFYFFSAPISYPEYGCREERPLAYDGFEEFARHGRIYWLDPDGKKHQLQVRPDA